MPYYDVQFRAHFTVKVKAKNKKEAEEDARMVANAVGEDDIHFDGGQGYVGIENFTPVSVERDTYMDRRD